MAVVRGAVIDKEKELDAAQDLIINLNKVSTLDRKYDYTEDEVSAKSI